MSYSVSVLNSAAAVVTGSTRGIGAEIAKCLADVGVSVVVAGRTESDGENVVSEINNFGGDAVFQQADMRNPEEINQIIETTITEFDRLDILVNNAAFETDTRPDEVDMETWDAILETNLRAYWLSSKFAYPYLKNSKLGTIVNIGSNHAIATQPKKFPYNMVKAGIDGMTRSLAVAWGVDGIRVNSVNPGWTMVDRIAEDLTDEEIEYLDRIHPLGRIGRPEDVADAVLYLASDMSSFVTGQNLVVDGGRTSILQDNLYLSDQKL